MDDRRRVLAVVVLICGFLLIVSILVGALVSRKKIISPIPESTGIKIILLTPTPQISP